MEWGKEAKDMSSNQLTAHAEHSEGDELQQEVGARNEEGAEAHLSTNPVAEGLTSTSHVQEDQPTSPRPDEGKATSPRPDEGKATSPRPDEGNATSPRADEDGPAAATSSEPQGVNVVGGESLTPLPTQSQSRGGDVGLSDPPADEDRILDGHHAAANRELEELNFHQQMQASGKEDNHVSVEQEEEALVALRDTDESLISPSAPAPMNATSINDDSAVIGVAQQLETILLPPANPSRPPKPSSSSSSKEQKKTKMLAGTTAARKSDPPRPASSQQQQNQSNEPCPQRPTSQASSDQSFGISRPDSAASSAGAASELLQRRPWLHGMKQKRKATPPVAETGSAADQATAAPSAQIEVVLKGPPVTVSTSTEDLENCSGNMDYYLFTRLLGEGTEQPVKFVPIPRQHIGLKELLFLLEKVYGKRLVVSFASPQGGLTELRRSTFPIFDSFDIDDRQLYCRALFPHAKGKLDVGCSTINTSDGLPLRAASALSRRTVDHAEGGRPPLLSPRNAADVSAGVIESALFRRVSTRRQEQSIQRLYEETPATKRKNLLLLEATAFPEEKSPLRITAEEETKLALRLTREFAAHKAKSVEAIKLAVERSIHGDKVPLQLTVEESDAVAQRFYEQAKEKIARAKAEAEEAAKKAKFVQFVKKSSAEEWADWQQRMSTPIKQKFKLKDQIY